MAVLQGGCGSGSTSFFSAFCTPFFCPGASRVLFRISRYFSRCCFTRTPVLRAPFRTPRLARLLCLSDCLTLSTPLQSMHHHMISFYYKITGLSSNSPVLHVPSCPPLTCNHRLQSIYNSLKLPIYILHLSDLSHWLLFKWTSTGLGKSV